MTERSTPIAIDLVQDIACPWCRIGKRNLEVALRTWDGPPVEVRFHPFLLNPAIPDEGYDFEPYMKQKFGGVADLAPMFTHVADAGRRAGLAFNFDRMTRAVSTLKAHRLIAMTPPDRQSALIDELYDAYFEHGQDIGSVAVLAEIAARHGWERERAVAALESTVAARETAAAAEQAARSGIGGVPFFILDQKLALSGAQPPEVMQEALRQAIVAEEIPAGGR